MDSKREREDLFRDFVQELRKRMDEERRAAKQAARDAYRKVRGNPRPTAFCKIFCLFSLPPRWLPSRAASQLCQSPLCPLLN